MLLGDIVPDFAADTSNGSIKSFHEFIGDQWCMLCSHPADFTPVCTTELGRLSQLVPDFEKRNMKVIAISCNDVNMHLEWIKDIDEYSSTKLEYPIIADPDRKIATAFGMIPSEGAAKDVKGLPLTARAVFIIGPDKRLKLQILYPATTGRNFNEILRVVDSLQLTATKSVATPSDWKQGEPCCILPSITAEQAEEKFPQGFKVVELPSGKPYLRMTEIL